MPAAPRIARVPGRSWSWGAALGVLAQLTAGLRAPRDAAADELAEARALLAYWEGRLRRLPRWALLRRREARATAARWRERVATAEELRYGRGLAGAASQFALERRMPVSLTHRGRQATRVAVLGAVSVAVTLALVFAAAVAVVAETVLGAL